MDSPNDLTMAALARSERDAHDFPLKSAEPSPVQLRRLEQAFVLALNLKTSANKIVPQWAIGAVALRLVLISGRSLDEIQLMKRAPITSAFNPDWPTPTLVERKGHAPALWLEAGCSPHRNQQSPDPAHTGVPSRGIWLGLDAVSLALLRTICPPARLGLPKSDPTRWPLLFSQEPNVLRVAIEAFKHHTAEHAGPDVARSLPNVGPCSQFLKCQLAASRPADRAVAWLATNTVPKRNATKSYYSSASLADVQRYQQTAIETLSPEAPAPLHWVTQPLVPPKEVAGRVIGSPLCPTDEALKMLGARLLKEAVIGQGTLDNARANEIDHAFTAYAWLFFSLHTGLRPSRSSLLPSPADIDWHAGALLVEDKRIRGAVPASSANDVIDDDLDVELASEDVAQLPHAAASRNSGAPSITSRRRWLPLSRRVLKQLELHYEHTAARERMRRRTRRPFQFAPLGTVPALEVYLGGLGGVNWRLPANFNRHYLRSRLIGRVSGDVIDAFLGHWELGSEPWWNGSCIDPPSYASQIHEALADLFPNDVWPSVHGFR